MKSFEGLVTAIIITLGRATTSCVVPFRRTKREIPSGGWITQALSGLTQSLQVAQWSNGALSKERGWAPWRKQSWISAHAAPPGWVTEASQHPSPFHLGFRCSLVFSSELGGSHISQWERVWVQWKMRDSSRHFWAWGSLNNSDW